MSSAGKALLPELHPLIAEGVAQDCLARDGYGFDRETARTLMALCLVDREFLRVAQPILWRSVCLRDVPAIAQLQECAEMVERRTGKAPYASIQRLSVTIPHESKDVPPRSLLLLMTRLAAEAHALQRWVWDVPFRIKTDKVWSAYNVELRTLWKQLPLRELVSIQDEVYFALPYGAKDASHAEWQAFPQLQRLALYNPILDDALFERIAAMPHLHTVVLMRSDHGWQTSSDVGDGIDRVAEAAAFRKLHDACGAWSDGSTRPLHLYISGGWATSILRNGMVHRTLTEAQQLQPSGLRLSLSLSEDGIPRPIEADIPGIYPYRDWVRVLIRTGEFWRGKLRVK